MALGFYINNKGCYGCKTCAMGCITTKLPENRESFLRHVHLILSDDPRAHSFLSMACNHCEKPACMANCPQNAIEKLDNGIVRIIDENCIGCQACVTACPYEAPVYDEATGKVYKCDMCYDRLEQGLLPVCVEVCPGANLECGELEELREKYPDAVQEIAGVTPSASETTPSSLIGLDPALEQ